MTLFSVAFQFVRLFAVWLSYLPVLLLQFLVWPLWRVAAIPAMQQARSVLVAKIQTALNLPPISLLNEPNDGVSCEM